MTVSFWSLITVEILISLAILIIWAIRLVKKGNTLVEKDARQNSKKKDEGSADSVDEKKSFMNDDNLLQLAKNHLRAKLDFNFDRINQTKKELVNYLDSEYKKLNRKYSHTFNSEKNSVFID